MGSAIKKGQVDITDVSGCFRHCQIPKLEQYICLTTLCECEINALESLICICPRHYMGKQITSIEEVGLIGVC